MSLIDNAAMKAGLELDRDVPRRERRKTKDWALLIGVARKLEVQERNELEAERRRYSVLATENARLTQEVFHLRERLLKYELAERMEEMAISPQHRQFLIEGKRSKAS
jgi:hypothetical protein